MTIRIPLLAALALAAAVARAEDVKLIKTEELQTRLKGKNVILVDSRTEVEFAEGHIPGAVLIPAKQTVSRLGEGTKKDALIVFYCNGPDCTKSRKAYKAAAAAGFTNLREYNDGLPAWKESALPVDGKPLPAVDLPAVEVKEARALLAGAKPPTIIDVRDADEFAAFHLPGALCFPLDAIQKKAKELPGGPILLVDHVGHQVKVAARVLGKLGHRDLRSLKGGIMAWNDAGLPTEGSK
jgi:rhodanese-related sulfurtransferase